MIMNKTLQCALLLVLYLCRAGRARLQDIAVGLNIPLTFLRVVATRLRLGRVIKSVKGPGGGYEINNDPTVRNVFEAISPVFILSQANLNKYAKGYAEHRALARAAVSFQGAFGPLMRQKVRNLNNELVANEMALLNRPMQNAVVN